MPQGKIKSWRIEGMHLGAILIILGAGSVTPQKMLTLGLENHWKGQRTVSLQAELFRT